MKQSIKTLSLVSLRVSPQNIVTLTKKKQKKKHHIVTLWEQQQEKQPQLYYLSIRSLEITDP